MKSSSKNVDNLKSRKSRFSRRQNEFSSLFSSLFPSSEFDESRDSKNFDWLLFCWVCCISWRISARISLIVWVIATLTTTIMTICRVEFIETTIEFDFMNNEYMTFFAEVSRILSEFDSLCSSNWLAIMLDWVIDE